MKFTINSQTDKIHTAPFGKVPKDRIENVTLEGLRVLQKEIFETSRRHAESGQRKELATDEEFINKLDTFRTNVGALWLKLSRQLDEDITKAYQVAGNFRQCMWSSIVRRHLRPQKYYADCGTPSRGYGGLVMYLANLPVQEEMVRRWGCKSWKEHVDEVWKTKNQLIKKEKEYRDAAVAIAQIGIGVGGMFLGLIGLGLSFVLSLLSLVL